MKTWWIMILFLGIYIILSAQRQREGLDHSPMYYKWKKVAGTMLGEMNNIPGVLHGTITTLKHQAVGCIHNANGQLSCDPQDKDKTSTNFELFSSPTDSNKYNILLLDKDGDNNHTRFQCNKNMVCDIDLTGKPLQTGSEYNFRINKLPNSSAYTIRNTDGHYVNIDGASFQVGIDENATTPNAEHKFSLDSTGLIRTTE